MRIRNSPPLRDPITQRHSMGCGVACIAFVLGVCYDQALELFQKPNNAWSYGFMCRDIVSALKRGGRNYVFKYLKNKRDPVLRRPGTIVFTRFSKRYPRGHYLARAKRGWMNPWQNFPVIAPAESGFVQRLPAEPTYAIYAVE